MYLLCICLFCWHALRPSRLATSVRVHASAEVLMYRYKLPMWRSQNPAMTPQERAGVAAIERLERRTRLDEERARDSPTIVSAAACAGPTDPAPSTASKRKRSLWEMLRGWTAAEVATAAAEETDSVSSEDWMTASSEEEENSDEDITAAAAEEEEQEEDDEEEMSLSVDENITAGAAEEEEEEEAQMTAQDITGAEEEMPSTEEEIMASEEEEEEEADAQETHVARAPAAAPATPAAPAPAYCLFHIHARCNDALQKTLDSPSTLQQELIEVQGEADVRQLFDEMYTLLFGTRVENVMGMCYSLEDLRGCLVVQDKAPEAGILGRCIFAPGCSHQSGRSSLFGSCAGPTGIIIYMAEHRCRSRLGVAMTIAHELMHVYCHGQKHLAGRVCVVLPGEEGLCELVAFYTGAFMVGGLQAPPQHNGLTRDMLRQDLGAVMGHLRGRQADHTLYRENFLQVYDEFRASQLSLEQYVNNMIQGGGIWSL